MIAAEGSSADLATALPFLFVALPGAWLVRNDKGIVIKVVASWLVAVSILAGTLSFAPVTPGYAPDHLE